MLDQNDSQYLFSSVKKASFLEVIWNNRYSILNLVLLGITFDSEKWYKTFPFQNYPHGSRHCRLSNKKFPSLLVLQIIVFLWKNYVFFMTNKHVSTLYLYDNWQWRLSCGLFVWQPTVMFAMWIIFKKKSRISFLIIESDFLEN